MDSSWFPKPVYKRVRWLAIFFITGSLVYAFYYPVGWLYTLSFIVIWLLFSIICSFNIQSGAYIKTINAGTDKINQIYLTFDDGPVSNTHEILEILDRYKVKASFFVKGENAKENEEILKKIRESGHCIGNHSFSHKSWFPILPVKKIREELEKTQTVLSQITGAAPQFFRPPFGVTNPLIAAALKSIKLKTIGWTIRSLDTVIKDHNKVISRVTRQLKPGCIVLLHDTTPEIGRILEAVLKTCKESGLKPVSLHKLEF